MPGLQNNDHPLARLAEGAARWMVGLRGSESSIAVYTAWAADVDGHAYPATRHPYAEFECGAFPEQPKANLGRMAVLSSEKDGEAALYPFAAYDNPNMTVDGGDY